MFYFPLNITERLQLVNWKESNKQFSLNSGLLFASVRYWKLRTRSEYVSERFFFFSKSTEWLVRRCYMYKYDCCLYLSPFRLLMVAMCMLFDTKCLMIWSHIPIIWTLVMEERCGPQHHQWLFLSWKTNDFARWLFKLIRNQVDYFFFLSFLVHWFVFKWHSLSNDSVAL